MAGWYVEMRDPTAIRKAEVNAPATVYITNIRIDSISSNPAPPADNPNAAKALINLKSMKFSISSNTCSNTANQKAAKQDMRSKSSIAGSILGFWLG